MSKEVDLKRLKDKIVVVTGATRGLGLALKTALERSNTVITIARSAEEDGKTAFKADVGNRAEVEAAMDKIGAAYGKIDVLINNAGYGMSGATELLSEEACRRIVDTNYFGVLWCSQCALKYMERGARIVNVGSASGFMPMPFRAMYNSTKAAVINLSYSLRMELKPAGIEVTVLVLPAIATEFSARRDKVVITSERYGKAVETADSFIDERSMDERMPLDRAVRIILRVMDKKKYRMHYIIGVPYKAANTLVVVFPGISQFFVRKAFGSVQLNKLLTKIEREYEHLKKKQ